MKISDLSCTVRTKLAVLASLTALVGCSKGDERTGSNDMGPVPVPVSELGIAPAELDPAELARPMTPIDTCNLERINGQPFTGAPAKQPRYAGPVRLSGWLASADLPGISEAQLRLHDPGTKRVWSVAVQPVGKRDDVLKMFGGNTNFASPGFSVVVDLGTLPPASYRAYLVFANGELLNYCDNGRLVVVEG